MDETPQFDRYAHDYSRLHRDSIRASGEEPGYFAANKADYVQRHLRAVGISPEAILDFGCGVGGTLGYLATRFPDARLHGVDVSEESVEMARAAHPAVDFGVIRDDGIPVPDASVDVAIAACVFHHIPVAERTRWMAGLRRALKPGGTLFVFEHNPLNPLTQKVVRDCPFDEDAILLPAGETTGLFRDAGFSSVARDYIVFFPNFLSALRRLEPYMGALPVGAQYVVHGRA